MLNPKKALGNDDLKLIASIPQKWGKTETYDKAAK